MESAKPNSGPFVSSRHFILSRRLSSRATSHGPKISFHSKSHKKPTIIRGVCCLKCFFIIRTKTPHACSDMRPYTCLTRFVVMCQVCRLIVYCGRSEGGLSASKAGRVRTNNSRRVYLAPIPAQQVPPSPDRRSNWFLLPDGNSKSKILQGPGVKGGTETTRGGPP